MGFVLRLRYVPVLRSACTGLSIFNLYEVVFAQAEYAKPDDLIHQHEATKEPFQFQATSHNSAFFCKTIFVAQYLFGNTFSNYLCDILFTLENSLFKCNHHDL
jgi:hypothetical protein